MKKLILVLATISISYGAYAQTDSTNRKMSPPDINNTDDGINKNRDMNKSNSQDLQNTHPDGVMMQNGKMVIVKGGRTTVLDQELTMSNGTRIMKDGTSIKKDGTKVMMTEGQHMDFAGNMVPMKTNKDKNMYLVPDSTKSKN